ncbi:MAG: hypothetical protein SFU56_00130 [Capsulimonadales bacterium]|nr:hypothetical protein [Capsulimonadales bacterium]
MNRSLSAFGVIATIAIVAPAQAAPTQIIRFGETVVRLDAGFLGALNTLGVAPSNIQPGRLAVDRRGNVFAGFPVTTGAIDLGTGKAEISHVGGLSLTAGSTVVELTDFDIDSLQPSPVLTGLVTVNGNLVGRLPLFSLMSKSPVNLPVSLNNGFVLQVSGIKLALTSEAAGALNSVFGINNLTGGIPIGVAATTAFVF